MFLGSLFGPLELPWGHRSARAIQAPELLVRSPEDFVNLGPSQLLPCFLVLCSQVFLSEAPLTDILHANLHLGVYDN